MLSAGSVDVTATPLADQVREIESERSKFLRMIEQNRERERRLRARVERLRACLEHMVPLRKSCGGTGTLWYDDMRRCPDTMNCPNCSLSRRVLTEKDE